MTLSLDLLQNASVLASSYPRRKRCLQSPVTVLQLLLTSNLVKKRQRVIVVAIANPIAHSKKIRVIFILKIPYPRTQKARGDNLLSRIFLAEFLFQKAELTHKTVHIGSSTAQKFRNTINQLKYCICSCIT